MDPSAVYHYAQMEYDPVNMFQDVLPERDTTSQASMVPAIIKNFVLDFQRQIKEQNVYEIQNTYDNVYNQLTEEYYSSQPWPEIECFQHLIGEDVIFTILYKELYYRHIYAKLQPTLEHRIESCYNYCNLFNYILNGKGPVALTLPNQWLWDIIDEFIYQFESFCQYRAKLAKKTDDEMKLLKESNKIWNVHSVLNVLYSLVDMSRINEQLEAYASKADPDSVAGEFGRCSLYKMLGYFSLIGLLRLHSLLGDYYQAIRVLGSVDLNKKTLYSTVTACQVTTYYYVGFAYMMMRRYQDAVRSFSNVLLYIPKAKQIPSQKSYQFSQIMKRSEQMCVLLSICIVLCPQRIDESIHQQLRDKWYEKMEKMQKGDMASYEEAFSFACPKFVSPVPPNYDAPAANYHLEPFNLQLRMFMNEVQQQAHIPAARSYLKLYTTMSIPKLANFLEMSEDALHTQLLCYKHKQRNLVWTKGTDALEGEFQSSSEVDFYIDQDMIHVADTKIARRYGDFFIRQIRKIEEINRKVQTIGVA